jgi:acetamidase/formamidase
MAHAFAIKPHHIHTKWSQSIPAALRIPSGETVHFTCRDGGNNQIRPDNASTAVQNFDFAQTDPAFGPVHVEGAEPGDYLKIEILDLQLGEYGWTAIFEGFGLLADEFEGRHLKMWDLSPASLLKGQGASGGRLRAVFDAEKGISVPLRPMLGVLGVAPAQAGVELSTIPPYALSGGNMDCRDFGVGTTLWLPVHVPGALFSCGDGHAAQGDGEVCGTAIEAPMNATIRLTVEKRADAKIQRTTPHFSMKARDKLEWEAEISEDCGAYAALGIHEDLREAARMALRGLLDWLVAEKGLEREQAYMLASVASSLKMAEVVDMPNYGVVCSLPLSVFDSERLARNSK